MNVFAWLRPRAGHPWIALGLAAIAVLPAAAAAQSGPEIMQKHRQVHRVKDEEEQLLLRLVSKSGAVKERRVTRFTMNGADDLNKILIRFLAPRDVENTALLTWEAKDGNDDQWLYLPATRNPKRIAAAGKKNRFMGTDFTYEDLRPENLAVHTYTAAGAEAIDGQDCWVIESMPANERVAADTAYRKRRLWIRKDNYALGQAGVLRQAGPAREDRDASQARQRGGHGVAVQRVRDAGRPERNQDRRGRGAPRRRPRPEGRLLQRGRAHEGRLVATPPPPHGSPAPVDVRTAAPRGRGGRRPDRARRCPHPQAARWTPPPRASWWRTTPRGSCTSR